MKKYKHIPTGKIAYQDSMISLSSDMVEGCKDWKEIKQVYEILVFKDRNSPEGQWNLLSDGRYEWSDTGALCTKEELLGIHSNCTYISSVKRLSDGEIFNIGDVYCHNTTPFNEQIIKSFHVNLLHGEDFIWISSGIAELEAAIDNIVKIKKPAEYTILSFKSVGGEVWYSYGGKDGNNLLFVDNKQDEYAGNGYYERYFLNNKSFNIHSVSRESDGVIFAIGDLVYFRSGNFKITKFEVNKLGLRVIAKATDGESYVNCGIARVEKANKVFTTEDGVDMYKGDRHYRLCKSSLAFDKLEAHEAHGDVEAYERTKKNYLRFSTLEAVKQYVMENKKCLTMTDVLTLQKEVLVYTYNGVEAGAFRKAMIELVKSRI